MSARQSAEPVIRRARAADLAAFNDIYNHYIREAPVTFDVTPIPLERREEWFRQFSESGPYQVFAAGAEGELQGFAWSLGFRAKEAYATSVETTIYLAPGAGGRGTGSRLYAALLDALRSVDLHRAYAGITLPNPASIALHRKLGFREVGTYDEVGRKFERWWNVQWFELRLDDPPGRDCAPG
jgi:phosphinothricin acetyltransferase